MKIALMGPISTESISCFLDGETRILPRGYLGAPLFGNLIGALLDRGHTVAAYTTSPDMKPSSTVVAKGERFTITYCPSRPNAFRRSGGYRGRAVDGFKQERTALREAIQRDPPDIVHAHWSYEFGLAAIESGFPHVVTCHDAPQVVLRHAPDLYRLVRYFMARRVLSRAQNLTAVSPYLQKMLSNYARAPISVVPNPLPAHSARPTSEPRRFDPARPRIAMVLNGWGALKNPKSALRAFALIRRAIPEVELAVMGSDYGPGGRAEVWARAQGLAEGVKFLGHRPYSELLSRLAESDLLLHPSLEETFGMSIAEAMSMGVPVVGGRKSGAVPWVVGEAGRLVDVRSPAAIADAALGLLHDAQALSEMSLRAKSSTLSRFSSEAVARGYEVRYRDVVAGVKAQ